MIARSWKRRGAHPRGNPRETAERDSRAMQAATAIESRDHRESDRRDHREKDLRASGSRRRQAIVSQQTIGDSQHHPDAGLPQLELEFNIALQ